MPTPNHSKIQERGTTCKHHQLAPIISITILLPLLLLALLLSCERWDELSLPTLPTVGLENLHIDGFILRASIQEGSETFMILERGFVITKDSFDSRATVVQGIHPEMDRHIKADTEDGPEFSASIAGLEINYQIYAAKAYLVVQFEDQQKTIYSRETAYGQTEGIRITSRAVEQNATLTLTFSILGLEQGESLSDHGVIWMDTGEEQLPALPKLQLGDAPNTIHLGELLQDSVGIAITPDLPRGVYLYLRPYAVFEGQPVYGDVREAYLGNYWETLGPEDYGEGPGRLAYATAFSINGKGYVVSGKRYSSNNSTIPFAASRECWQFDPEDNSWTRMPRLPGPGRCYATSFVIGDKAYVGGGWNGRDTVYRDYYEFSPTEGWNKVGDMVNYIYAPSTFVLDDKAYIAVGRRCDDGVESDDCRFTGRLYQFDPQRELEDQWMRVSGHIGDEQIVFLPVTFAHHSTAYLGTGIDTHDGFKYSFHSYTPDEGGWSLNVTDLPGPARWAAFSFEIDEQYYVGGGAHYCDEFFFFTSWENCGGYQDVWRFDPANETAPWAQMADVNDIGFFAGAAFSIGGKGYVYGGLETTGEAQPLNTLKIYTPDQ